jgi:hypothetical protein
MIIPDIKRYKIEEVEVPAPKEREQVIREALGISPPTPPPGPPRKMFQITIEADMFPHTNTPYNISIGNQKLLALATTPGGFRATALLERVPSAGEEIAFHFPAIEEGGEARTVVAAVFDTAKLDSGIA